MSVELTESEMSNYSSATGMKLRFGMLFAIALVLSGCGASYSLHQVDEKELSVYLQDKPEELHPLFTRILAEGERNHVLNRLRAGLAAMELGYHDLAARTFDEALLTIETIYGDNEGAAAARSLFSAEDRKVFRGEPYERAMAYYYRGLLYLADGDYENARASFKSGSLQDSLAESEEYRQDFALLEFLEGWASQCNGDADLAREAYALAREHNSALTVPDRRDDLLAVAELGYAPVKYTEGEHNELLKIKANSKKGPKSARITLAGRSESLPNSESILWQAVTRGGREFDSILAGKVEFKQSADTASDIGEAVAGGAAYMATSSIAIGDYDTAGIAGGIGMAAGLFSALAGAASSATETAADTRQWDNLPEKIAYGTFQKGAVARPVVELDGSAIDARRMQHGGDGACEVVWTSHTSSNTKQISDIWERVAGKTYAGKINWGWGSGRSEYTIEISFSRSGKYVPLGAALGNYADFGSNDWHVEDGTIVLRESGYMMTLDSNSLGAYGIGEFRGNTLVIRGKTWVDGSFFEGGYPPDDFIALLEEIEQ